MNSLLYGALLLAFIITYLIYIFHRKSNKDLVIFFLALFFIILFLLSVIKMNANESFYFEVSPQRKKCLEEQVSLSGKPRSCSCCQKGTVGGYPGKYLDWFDSGSDSGNWYRADNWSVNKEAEVPPIEKVDNPPKTLNRSVYNV